VSPEERIDRLREFVDDRKLPWGTRKFENGDIITSFVVEIPWLLDIAEAALRVVDDSGCGRYLVAFDPERGDVNCDTVEMSKLDALRERVYGALPAEEGTP
jgi:hypothetical protein